MTHEELTAALSTAGDLPEGWAATFAEVDRAWFIPVRIWFDDEHGRSQPLDRERAPDRWRGAVYSDEPIVTQLDDGATVWPATSNAVTSSASQPSMMLAMLDALDVHKGQRVLEIGTGTGHHAALLAHRLGEHSVTSVEVDAVLAEQARLNLTAAGYNPTVVCADGAKGWAATAPYDRLVATAAVLAGQLPYTWVEQTRPGGLILTPWGTAYHNGALVRLTVHEDGTATGRVVGSAAFMRLRDQRTPFGHATRLGDLVDASATESITSVELSEVTTGEGAFSVGLQLPGVQCGVYPEDDGGYEVLLYHVASESVASVPVTEHSVTGRHPVRQHGPRRLWDEAERAHRWWVGCGKPARTRYGLTITPTAQHLWLDEPARPILTHERRSRTS
ncbi:MAG: methyltransferase domain-containing protein [Pseudonocardiaceae bacterium]